MRLDVLMWLAAMTMLMFGLAACGTSGTPSGTTTNAAGGGIAQNGGTTINRDSPAFQAAVAACNKEGS
jgi:hypothetical protein